VPHITLKSIANNAEIDTIWEAYQEKLEPLRAAINDLVLPGTGRGTSEAGGGAAGAAGGLTPAAPPPPAAVPLPEQARGGYEEWQMPREAPAGWPDEAKRLLDEWWSLRIARQREIDASIAAKADTEYLYDQPYVDNSRVRVAGPFTVESLSPHRVPAVDVDDSLFDELEAAEGRYKSSPERGGGSRAAADGGGPLHPSPAASGPPPRSGEERSDFAAMILDNLKKSGVQQAHKADRLVFSSIKPWPGHFVCAEGRVRQSSDPEDAAERRAAILVGPEYGTVARADLTAAAREAMEAGFDLLIAAAFNFDAHASEFDRMGALTVLQARINPDLHMPDLANTGAGNLFTVFGEPDIQVHDEGEGLISIEVAGVDMYKGGQIESTSADDIAVWFIDTDYNYESFFVRHAYFPGANDPYKALKTSLKAEIDPEAWETLKRTRSRPFARPAGGKVAVKVINHLGDEVMKVVGV
jgi:adenine-specific DNA-methyltransferase